ITQEVFLRLWRSAPKWQPCAALSTWLHRVTVNCALSIKRRIRAFRRARVAMPAPRVAEQLLANHEMLRIVRQSVLQLRPRQRAVLSLPLDAASGPNKLPQRSR